MSSVPDLFQFTYFGFINVKPIGVFWYNTFSYPHTTTGQIIIKDSSTGQQLLSVTRLLTPGPLVVGLLASPAAPDPQHYWPPTDDTNIETVAASYVPPDPNTAHVRLFNMAPSFPSGDLAGFKIGDKVYASKVSLLFM